MSGVYEIDISDRFRVGMFRGGKCYRWRLERTEYRRDRSLTWWTFWSFYAVRERT